MFLFKKKSKTPPPNNNSKNNYLSNIEKAQAAVLSIITPFGSGSGVVISKGLGITNKHVVKIGADIVNKVKINSEAEVFDTDILKVCHTVDLAFF